MAHMDLFTSTQPVFQVSEFVEAVNQHLSLLGEVIIEGEISRLDVKNGRLIFITIKDSSSSIDVFSMPYLIRNLSQLEPGMLVRVTGTAGLYKGSGKFRLFASSIFPQGEGALQIAFEKLKHSLESEGLFDPSHKRSLPKWPSNIGLVTAKGSSAQADLLKILTQRLPGLILKTLPVNVQGYQAVPTLLKALASINHHPEKFDLVIIARGGGSLEDLAAFNDESVVRAVFACKVPIISAIGHEDDWTLVDFVSDLRASTPSNAAELAIQDRSQVLSDTQSLLNHIKIIIKRHQQVLTQRIHQPLRTIKLSLTRLESEANRLSTLLIRHHQQTHSRVVSLHQETIVHHRRLKTSLNHHLEGSRLKHQNIVKLLDSYNLENTLKRGFSITRVGDTIIKSAAKVKPQDVLVTQLYQGTITSILKE
jgi:exodeoxyribonuclease VII large subunit